MTKTTSPILYTYFNLSVSTYYEILHAFSSVARLLKTPQQPAQAIKIIRTICHQRNRFSKSSIFPLLWLLISRKYTRLQTNVYSISSELNISIISCKYKFIAEIIKSAELCLIVFPLVRVKLISLYQHLHANERL